MLYNNHISFVQTIAENWQFEKFHTRENIIENI